MIFNKEILKGKIALISGGATGICYGIADQFLRHGAGVYIISRKIDNINKAVAKLKQDTGNINVWGSSCDVRDQKQVQQTVKTVIEKAGKIDILINGAAGNFLAPFQNLSPNAFKTVMMIDTFGTFLLSKFVNQYAFSDGGDKVIINITAGLHYNGTLMQSHAGSAKAAVDALTRHLSVQLGPKGVRVVGICPGPIENTEGYRKLRSADEDSQLLNSLIPMKRAGTTDDIAYAAIFLASGGASYITGQILVVDGGQHMTFPNFPFSSQKIREGYGQSGIKPKL